MGDMIPKVSAAGMRGGRHAIGDGRFAVFGNQRDASAT
jgi:hypothetical protein